MLELSELIQVKKQITFEQLCPKWFKSIQTGVLESGLDGGFSHCIVGEAYGFKGPYNCSECNVHATGLVNWDGGSGAISIGVGYNDAWKVAEIKEELFEQRKEAFMEHWNEKHT